MKNYPLPITHYQLPITNYQLPITHYQLPIIGPFVVGDLSPQSRETRATVINRYFVWLFRLSILRAIKDLRRQKFRGAKLLPTLEVFKLSYGPQSDFLINTFCRGFVALLNGSRYLGAI